MGTGKSSCYPMCPVLFPAHLAIEEDGEQRDSGDSRYRNVKIIVLANACRRIALHSQAQRFSDTADSLSDLAASPCYT